MGRGAASLEGSFGHRLRRLALAAPLAAAAFWGAAPGARAQDGLKLGVLNDLSGAFSDLGGRGSIVAAQMAVDDFGGRVLGGPIAIVSADSQNKPDIATGIARRWFDAEGVDAIVDPVPSSVALGLQSLVRERRKIMIIASSGLADLTGKACTGTSFQWAYDTSVLAKGTAGTVAGDGHQRWFFVAADVAFGQSLMKESEAVVAAKGGTTVGEVRSPYLTSDFSSFLLQAQAARPDVIALATSGSDTTNAVKQAVEFGIGEGSPKLVALLAFVTDVKSLGLDRAHGLLLTESFYWDLDDGTRAFAKRFADRFEGKMPSMAQAAVYSGVTHYLKAMARAGTKDAEAVAAAMREMPVDDFMIHGGRVRPDGRVVHDFYLFEVKTPAESRAPWDLYKLVRRIPAAEVTPPEGSTGCPF